MKRKVAVKDNKEGGDHDVRDDWARFSIKRDRSCPTWEVE